MKLLKFGYQKNCFILFIFLVSISCHPLKIKETNSSFYPYHFENIQVKLLKIKYRVNPHGPILQNSDLPTVPDSLIYRAQVFLKFYPDSLVWNKPVLLVIDTQDESTNLWFNQEGMPLSNSGERTLVFTFKTKFNTPLVRFTLGIPGDAEMNYVPDYQNIFRSRELNLPTRPGQRVVY